MKAIYLYMTYTALYLLINSICMANSLSHEATRRANLVRITYDKADPSEIHPPRGILFSW